MQSTLTLCLTILLNIAPIYCAHVIRDIFEDSVNIVHSPLYPPVSNGYSLTMKRKRAIKNWVPKVQFAQTMNYYDLSSFVENLDLQHCVIVEIGEGFCALFVETLVWEDAEFKPNGYSPNEQFLGICDCATIRSWHLCRTNLKEIRREDCTFEQATNAETNSARVHRRLCDISGMALWNTPCNCSQQIAQQLLVSVTGFPTCYLPPLPDSLCLPRSVCGVYACQPIKGRRIMSVICNTSLCPGSKPFCEYPIEQTSKDRTVTSIWTPWSRPMCNTTCGFGFMVSESVCVDSGGNPALDCIGPGSSCCSANETQCECRVIHRNDNVMIVTKLLGPCSTYTPCSVVGVTHDKRQASQRNASAITAQRDSISPSTLIKKTNGIEDGNENNVLNTNSLRGQTGRQLDELRFARPLYDSRQLTNARRIVSAHERRRVQRALRKGDWDRKRRSQTLSSESETPEECFEKLQSFSDDNDNRFKDREELGTRYALPYRGASDVQLKNTFEIEGRNLNHFQDMLDEAYEGRRIDEGVDAGSLDVCDQYTRPQSRKLLSFDDYDDAVDQLEDYNDYDIIGEEHTITKKDLADGDFLMGLESDIDELEDSTKDVDSAGDLSFGNNNRCESTTKECKDDDDDGYDDDEYDDDDDEYDDDDDDYDDGDDDDDFDEVDDLITGGESGCGKPQVEYTATTSDFDLFPTEATLSPADDPDEEEEEDLDDDADEHTAVKGPPALDEPQQGLDGRHSLIDKVVEENSAERSHGKKTISMVVVVLGWRFLNDCIF